MVRVREKVESVRGKGFVRRLSSVSSMSSVSICIYIYTLYMYVCIYVCIYIYIYYICMYVCMYVCVCVCVYIYAVHRHTRPRQSFSSGYIFLYVYIQVHT